MIGSHYTLHAILENLFVIAHAAYLGFRKAARQLEWQHPRIGLELRAKAELRRHHSRDLHKRLAELGLDANSDVLLSGALQSAWSDSDILLETHDTNLLIGICISGEEDAFRAYSQSLEPHLDPATEWILLRQRDQIQAGIKDLYAHFLAYPSLESTKPIRKA